MAQRHSALCFAQGPTSALVVNVADINVSEFSCRQNPTATGVHPGGGREDSQPISRGSSNHHPYQQQGGEVGQQHEEQRILYSCL